MKNKAKDISKGSAKTIVADPLRVATLERDLKMSNLALASLSEDYGDTREMCATLRAALDETVEKADLEAETSVTIIHDLVLSIHDFERREDLLLRANQKAMKSIARISKRLPALHDALRDGSGVLEGDFLSAMDALHEISGIILKATNDALKLDQNLHYCAGPLLDEAANEAPEKITAVAVYHGCTFSLPAPARHCHVMATISKTLSQDAMRIPPENQGFLTSKGRFVNRVEAKLIAHKAKQIIRHSAGDQCPELYSEDLW